MCIHTLFFSHMECLHLSPAIKEGKGYIPPRKCLQVRAAYDFFHTQPDRSPSLWPFPVPKLCPPVWGTVNCQGNVVGACRPGKCYACQRKDIIANIVKELRDRLRVDSEPESAKHSDSSDLVVALPEDDQHDLRREMTNCMENNRDLFTDESIEEVVKRVYGDGCFWDDINPLVDWLFVALSNNFGGSMTLFEQERTHAFLSRFYVNNQSPCLQQPEVVDELSPSEDSDSDKTVVPDNFKDGATQAEATKRQLVSIKPLITGPEDSAVNAGIESGLPLLLRSTWEVKKWCCPKEDRKLQDAVLAIQEASVVQIRQPTKDRDGPRHRHTASAPACMFECHVYTVVTDEIVVFVTSTDGVDRTAKPTTPVTETAMQRPATDPTPVRNSLVSGPRLSPTGRIPKPVYVSKVSGGGNGNNNKGRSQPRGFNQQQQAVGGPTPSTESRKAEELSLNDADGRGHYVGNVRPVYESVLDHLPPAAAHVARANGDRIGADFQHWLRASDERRSCCDAAVGGWNPNPPLPPDWWRGWLAQFLMNLSYTEPREDEMFRLQLEMAFSTPYDVDT